MKLRIKEAIKLHEIYYGRRITQRSLAAKIWKNSKPEVRSVLMYRLSSNRYYKTVRPEWIKIIANETHIEYEYIMGTMSSKTYTQALEYYNRKNR